MRKWELCFVRPQVVAGVEVVFVHPIQQKSKEWRNLADFVKSKSIKVEHGSSLLGTALSIILSEGLEPLNVGGGMGHWKVGGDLGATGYAFRRELTPS